jgi:hypothetical protein
MERSTSISDYLQKNRKYRAGTGFPESTWRDHSFFLAFFLRL